MSTTSPSQAFDPDFDAVYAIDAQGRITPANNIYPADVFLDPETDVYVAEGWATLTGHTQQQSYRGAVMHPSEQWGQWAVDALQALAGEHGVIAFVVVEVRDEDGDLPDGDPIGWAVAYRSVCEVSGDNHSDDLIEVWTGRPSPRTLCGFHVSAGA